MAEFKSITFEIGVICFERKPVAGALEKRDIQRMVAAGALIDPGDAVAHIRVRARPRWHVRCALRHPDSLCGGNRGASRGCAAADASLRIRAHLGRGCISILTEWSVVRLAAHVGHLKHEVVGELALHRKTPLLMGWREQVGIDSAGCIDRARLRYPGGTSGRKRGR